MRHSLLVVIASSLSLASTATAGLLPSKPSQLADVSSGSHISCKFFAQAYAIDTVQESDGTAATFEIPAKHVFVVTSVDFNIQGPASGHRYEAARSRAKQLTTAPVGSPAARTRDRAFGTAELCCVLDFAGNQHCPPSWVEAFQLAGSSGYWVGHSGESFAVELMWTGSRALPGSRGYTSEVMTDLS